ncbi:LysE family transporter [uncultured Oscillibacter sp.]|uniref:LysE family transporter n=1 Tax=uncultured Oscillibacter sp. TaxID=876091 RepID=UPI002631AE2E|nr:LysE family transporter [uncultured Oscillibacter sp.]
MPASLLPSFLLYCYVGAITPGPANLCSLSTALRYGKGPALRQWRGLFTGFFLVSMAAVLATWLMGTLLNQYVGALSWVGAVYLLWMAWHTLRASSGPEGQVSSAPGFLSGLLVNLTNVKVMIFCLMALASYVLPYTRSLRALLAVGLFMPFTGPLANLVWLFAGAALQKLFVNHRKAVDRACAAALALCAVTLVRPH